VPLAEFWYNTTLHSSLGKTPLRFCMDMRHAISEWILWRHVLSLICSSGCVIELT
jgi:hypothetical protein